MKHERCMLKMSYQHTCTTEDMSFHSVVDDTTESSENNTRQSEADKAQRGAARALGELNIMHIDVTGSQWQNKNLPY